MVSEDRLEEIESRIELYNLVDFEGASVDVLKRLASDVMGEDYYVFDCAQLPSDSNVLTDNLDKVIIVDNFDEYDYDGRQDLARRLKALSEKYGDDIRVFGNDCGFAIAEPDLSGRVYNMVV